MKETAAKSFLQVETRAAWERRFPNVVLAFAKATGLEMPVP